jgi:Glycosyl hydrolase family 20, catalytic domain
MAARLLKRCVPPPRVAQLLSASHKPIHLGGEGIHDADVGRVTPALEGEGGKEEEEPLIAIQPGSHLRVSVHGTSARAIEVLPGRKREQCVRSGEDSKEGPRGSEIEADEASPHVTQIHGREFDADQALQAGVERLFARVFRSDVSSDDRQPLVPNVTVATAVEVELFLVSSEELTSSSASGAGQPPSWEGSPPQNSDDAFSMTITTEDSTVRIGAWGTTHAGLNCAVQLLAQLLSSSLAGTRLWENPSHAHGDADDDVRPPQGSPLLPLCSIQDWPDFAHRGFMLDVSRSRVPTMEALFELVEQLSFLRQNELQLYLEHVFAYSDHEEAWEGTDPLTGPELQELDFFCRTRFVELVPNQNSLGHMHQWLKHSTYRDLAECPDGVSHPFSLDVEPFSLDPQSPEVEEFVDGLYAQLLPNFSSRTFNVGLDEAFDLMSGRGRSAAVAAEKARQGLSSNGKGTDVVFMDYLLKTYEKLQHMSLAGSDEPSKYVMQFWADILLEFGKSNNRNAQRLLNRIPRDGSCVALVWGYEANSPLDRDCGIMAEANIPFYVCPGTSSWCSITGRTDNVVENIFSAAAAGVKHGARGLLVRFCVFPTPTPLTTRPSHFRCCTCSLTAKRDGNEQNTDWGDCGHLQPFEISFLGLCLGAAHAWNHGLSPDAESARTIVPTWLDCHFFGECVHQLDNGDDGDAKSVGQFAYDLGNFYKLVGPTVPNSSIVFWPLHYPNGLHESQAIKAGVQMVLGGAGSWLLSAVGGTVLSLLGKFFGFSEQNLRHQIDQIEIRKHNFVTSSYCSKGCHDERALHCLRWSADLLQLACELAIHRHRLGLHRPVADLPPDVRDHLADELQQLLQIHKDEIRPFHSRPGEDLVAAPSPPLWARANFPFHVGGTEESHRALQILLRQLQTGKVDDNDVC